MSQLMQSTAIDWRGCPLVEVVPGKVGGIPILKATRMPADGVLENYDAGISPEEIADLFELPLESVREVLSYATQQRAAFAG